ncbi:uncharacterized protein [Spinacia oleracea]|uniref:CCHC-type domain-containing protein n=1 Tax=Spinacia oleracea TaxID=3562 RepID=A0A9R0IGK9_SPIOL|nr:uncharacterized protein LOC110788454 [Spinacia oleracea]
MMKVWAPANNMVIRVIGPNLFAFQFFHWRDKEKVLMGRPWCWENHLVVLKEVAGDEQPENVILDRSPFWVRVCKLPFNCRSNAYVKALTAGVGEFLDIEEDVLGLDRYRQIKLMIDITKPIRRNQKLKDRRGREVMVEFKYERLPYFCLACGIIGHSERDCLNVPEEDKKKELGWSLSLRASPRKGRSKEMEELATISKGRTQLFVTREQASSPKVDQPGLQVINLGQAEDKVEGSKATFAVVMGQQAVQKEEPRRVEEVTAGTDENQVALALVLRIQGIWGGKKWKRAGRAGKGISGDGVLGGDQKRGLDAVDMEIEDGEGGNEKRNKLSSHVTLQPNKSAEVGDAQPHRSQ